eukprot:c52165_g1_i1.p1 GENE.c52165_g1_i1~~c52165_g1_i1.p1  ORF type:complete len:460 (-),score=89.00 c52165_g1_i1:56-1435(-)
MGVVAMIRLVLFALVACVLSVPVAEPNALETNVAAVRRWTFNGVHQVGILTANQPTICYNGTQYSGYFSLEGTNKKYFYWFFESARDAKDPTLMWLTGGPGCSSMLALLSENGPCTVNEDGATTTPNPYSWNAQANLLFVDQPPGTGFSEGSFDHNEDEVSEDMYQFLQAFFGSFKQYNTTFFVFGESYAGHYVPAVSHRIWQGNQQFEGSYIPLVGVSVGNGLTDPQIQYAYYAEMAYNSTTAPRAVSKAVYDEMTRAIPGCIALIAKCQSGSSLACDQAFSTCNQNLISPFEETGINQYDMRIPCKIPGLCYNFTAETVFLNRADVQKQLGVNKEWETCNMIVNSYFQADWMHNFQNKIPDMLGSGIRVLIYAGDVDFICNWLGNKAWTLALDWVGKSEFNNAEDHPWYSFGVEAGKIRTASNFTFLQVYQAGHMVPMDQPAASLDMVNTFLDNTLA